MLKYIFMPTGRKIWSKLAINLNKEGIAIPTVWIGDEVLDKSAQNLSKDIEIIKFKKIHTEIEEIPIKTNLEILTKIYNKAKRSEIKQRAIKLMDRHDHYGSFKNIDREVFFKSMVFKSIDLIHTHNPDFMLMSESPHAPFQYILFEVANEMGVPTFSFSSWSIAPLCGIRKGINPPEIEIKSNPKNKDEIELEISKFLEKFEKNTDTEPYYIKKQKQKDQQNPIKKSLKSISKIIKDTSRELRKKPKLDREIFDETPLRVLNPIIKNFIVKRNLKSIKNELKQSTEIYQITETPYVYFPLHYEPERTTNPDGGDYYDQIDALIDLRLWLPENIKIIVKEHYSQFSSALHGHKGRSKHFYKIIKNIPGIEIIDIKTDSKELIKNSRITATITGTAALESAILGIPSIIMGNPWFTGCPGTFSFNTDESYDSFQRISGVNWSISDIRKWLMEKSKNSLFLTINPSNENYFNGFYDKAAEEDELEKLTSAITSIIAPDQLK